jgi:saccharopine dehydrogenase-like NADP-dependent oxidoreductase
VFATVGQLSQMSPTPSPSVSSCAPSGTSNTFYPCQGNLRQFIINANALGGEGSLTQAGSGQLDTGVPPSIVAQLLAAKVIDRPGVLAPEDAVPPEPFLAELATRNMEVTLVTRERSVP